MQGKKFFNKQSSNNLKKNRNQAESNIDIYDLATTVRNEGTGKISSDVSGSYTGMSNDGERPIQDVDDL